MILLVGVLNEGGVPVVVRNYASIESEMIIGPLIAAAKTLCDVMGSGEVRQLAFKDNTLIVTESAKGYTIVALVDRAEAYMESFLKVIAEEVDDSSLPVSDGSVTDIHIKLVEDILSMYIKEQIGFSIREIVSKIWAPIQDAAKRDSDLSGAISSLEQKLESADLTRSWQAVVSETPASLDSALEFALKGEYDRACAASRAISDDHVRAFHIKMGHLARSMSSTRAPPLDELAVAANAITGTDPFLLLGQSLFKLLAGEISSQEYISSLKLCVESFDFKRSRMNLLRSFMFLDPRISLFDEFARSIAEHLRDESPIAFDYIMSILDRESIFEKLYSVSSYDDFKDTIGFYKGRIDEILGQIDQSLKKGIVKRITRGPKMTGLALRASLQLQNYITLLTALAESPVLTVSERKGVLGEVIDLYWSYFRRLLLSELPIFSHTIDSVFQSLGVANAEFYYLSTGDERKKHLSRIGTFLQDVLQVAKREWVKDSVRFSIHVILNALGPVLTREGLFKEEDILLHFIAMKATDIDAIERSRTTSPSSYATNVGNMLTSFAAVAYSLLSGSERDAIFSECVLKSLEVQMWFVSNGIVCRDDIMAVTYHTSFAMDMLDDSHLPDIIKIVTALNRVAVQNPQKYDYEVASMGSSLIGVLSKGWERLGNRHYLDMAKNLLQISANGWRKYGFKEKADNLEKLYWNILSS